ncbi:saccharopine dehydrogenase family protein [Sphingobium sp. Cam5-1]|uniref:saccharopine dehydrogenase family protein n=1 Tax=Sphingobium sp. Cam5-1 TaxID=2789327 RepID=UPI0018AD2774|nr:saccharopine dehydrogenase NADP-binding domain-containing protein [Sphingobium sp. Cam5-1]QPI75123.1 saccharopine dehydrogenase NADP-binding domain-containing protein [Sphingobium sp. Cam5-1]
MKREFDVVVIGAGGRQAQAMLAAAARGTDVTRWLALDRAWRPETLAATQALGMQTREQDPLADAGTLDALMRSTAIVANLAGPYYRTGFTVLDAAIGAGTDYLDICDDADITVPILSRDEAAKAAGVTAIIGLGSTPGVSNILIRLAVDHLKGADDVEIAWVVDAKDMTEAATKHFWHCFNLVDFDGTVHPVPLPGEMDSRVVDFPGTVGRQTVVKLAHPEPLTVPRFLPVKRAVNYGAIAPIDAHAVAAALAAVADEQQPGSTGERTDMLVKAFQQFLARFEGGERIGSGLQIDVHTNGNGLRYASGADTSMEEATGVPAAAGVIMLAEGDTPRGGVFAPEALSPAKFFAALRRVSLGGGGLGVYRLENGRQGERLRIRDLMADTSEAA